MAGEIVRRRPNHSAGPPHLPPRPLQEAAFRRHRPVRFPPAPAGPIIPKHRTDRAPPTPAPPVVFAARSRRRHPPTPNPLAPFVARRRPAHAVHLPPAAALASLPVRRGHVAAPTAPIVGRRRMTHPARVPALPLVAARSRRRRLPGIGLSATSFIVRRPRRAREQAPIPAAAILGHGRRRKPLGTGLNALAFVVRRTRKARPVVPLPAARLPHSRRRRLPGSGLSANSFVVRRARAIRLAKSHPPSAGKSKRGKFCSTGAVAGPMVIGRHRTGRAYRVPTPLAVSRRHFGRRPWAGTTAASNVVLGPFWWEELDVWAGGFEQGDIVEG